MACSEGALDMAQLDGTLECDPLIINSTIDDYIFIQDNMYVLDDDVDTKTMLYHGSNIMSCFQAIAILVLWFSRFPGVSKNSFTH